MNIKIYLIYILHACVFNFKTISSMYALKQQITTQIYCVKY